MRKYLVFIRRHKTKVAVFGICMAAVVLYMSYVSNSNSGEQILVVRPAPFLQQISVSGKVVAASDADLGFSQSGRVTRIYAKVGQQVRQGTLLAEIENGDVRANVLQKQAALASQQAKLESLKQGTRAEDIAVAQSSVDGALSALAQANQTVINAITDAYAKSDDAIHNKLDQFISNPRGPNPQLSFTTSSSQLTSTVGTERIAIEKTLDDWRASNALLNTSSDPNAAASQVQSYLAAVSNILTDASNALARAVPSPNASQSSIDGYAVDITTARTTINTSIASLNSALTAQKAAVSALETARKTLALKQAGSTPQDIAAQLATVQAAQADLQNAQAQLQKTLVVAPFDGIVTRMDAKVGQVIAPGTPEISMISGGKFQIETFVPEVQISGLMVGNPATITLDAYGASESFEASVISIDPAETILNGISTYKTMLQFKLDDVRIRSGMTADVVITTSQTPQALVVPQGAIFLKNAKQVVRVRSSDDKVVDVEVVVGGSSSLGNVEIISGLKDGDRVILNPDTTR